MQSFELNREENKGDEICEKSDENPEDVMEEEDPEEEIFEEEYEEPEEDLEEEIIEELEEEEEEEEELEVEINEEGFAAESSHLSSAISSEIESKVLGNEPIEDLEDKRGKKVVEKSGSEPISNFVNPKMSCHTNITRTIKDQNQYLLENPVLSSSSVTNACKAGYQLENASKVGSPTLEACESQKKFLNEECSKPKPDVTSAVSEHDGEIGIFKAVVVGECAYKQQGHGHSRKRGQSRWDFKQEQETLEIDGDGKRRKTRWDNIDSQNGLFSPSGFINSIDLSMDPKIISLKLLLMEINKKLQSSEIHDAVIRKKLMNESKRIISELAEAMTFKSPAKREPTKFVRKLLVPEKEYPTYNFVGLILGPKGNTLKKMEKETGAKIFIRGKGSGQPDSAEDEDDLHVRVEAYNQQALDAAVVMIEKLLIPVADENNDHKRAQLVQLAKLRGTYKDHNICDLCKEQGHRKYACPLQDSTFQAVCCDICGSFGHLASSCNVSRYKNQSNKEVDHADLYVGYLSHAIDENRLKELFVPFGEIVKTTVVRDQTTGLSKGYGFVKFVNPSDAAAAVIYMNGYKMDGKMLAVRVAGQRPVPGPFLHSGQFPINSSHTAGPSQTSCSYGPSISVLPDAPFSTVNDGSLCFPSSRHNINVAMTDPRATSYISAGYDFRVQIPSSLPNSISQFPGDPDYPDSEFKSYFTSPVMNAPQNQRPETAKNSSVRLDPRFL